MARPPEQAWPPHDLGVLLVHGIGDQKQGETLDEFGAPIILWINQWLAPDRRVTRLVANLAPVDTKDLNGSATFNSAVLRPPDLPADTPAHATVDIVTNTHGAQVGRQSWLFAESWWSPQTLAPRVSPFLIWLITRGPWILLLHLSQSAGLDVEIFLHDLAAPRGSRGFLENVSLAWRFGKFAVVTMAWLFISLLLIVVWGIVSIVALVPIGYVRKLVYDFLLAITGVVGDSYVLINDPVQHAAFCNTVRRGLDWLHGEGCKKVAVVAHSQGAAVARDVLISEGARQVDLFITLGAGIAKLDALADRERRAPQHFLWCGAAAPLSLLTVTGFVRLWMGGQGGFALWGFPSLAGLLALAAIFITWRSAADSLARLKPEGADVLRLRGRQPLMYWKDFYSTHDPVPNGSLSATTGSGIRRIVSHQVTVLASRLQDHTSYWTSRADFVPRVAQALDRCAGAGLFATTAGRRRLRVARGNFRRSVRWLSMLRRLALIAFVIPILQIDRVRTVAHQLRDWLTAVPIDSVKNSVLGLQGLLAWTGLLITGRGVSAEGATAVLLLMLLAGAVLNVWGRVVAYWWHHAAALCLAPVFHPSDEWPARIKQWLLILLVSALGVLPLALSAAWTLAPGVITWSELDTFLGQFATLTCMLAYAGLVVLLASVTSEFGRQVSAAYKTHHSVWGALTAVPDLWAVPASWAFYVVGGGALLFANRYTISLLPLVGVLAALAGAIFVFVTKGRPVWRSLRRRLRSP